MTGRLLRTARSVGRPLRSLRRCDYQTSTEPWLLRVSLALCAIMVLAGVVSAQQAPARANPDVRTPTVRAQHVAPLPTATVQAKRPLLGDQTDGSRARPVHTIPLRDPEGEIIRPTDRPLPPFSPPETCGADCHDVRTVTTGWHFNVTNPGSGRVRPGEPWLLVDLDTATELPLSYHGWRGTYHPEQVGVTPWAFASLFGGRTPGGLGGRGEHNPDLQTRWMVSGELEPDCLACHDASAAYDHAEYGRQVALENFRWAPTAASGLALVTGSAKEMPNTFDYLLPFVEDSLLPRVPAVVYSAERFLPNAKVVFDIVRDVPARRCYFCHSNADVAHTGQGRWRADQDIHLARGMTCVDCHRNGLDHAMNRGYEGEPAADRAAADALTCRGCHLAKEAEGNFARGRFGAPYPTHAGIPPIHFTKLSCTACHSGPRPEKATRALKTSLAHRLAGFNVNKAADALPHLYYPVFQEEPNGQMVPKRAVWPAFWGTLSNGKVTPIEPERVKTLMARAKVTLKPSPSGNWPALDEATIAKILDLLAGDATSRARSSTSDLGPRGSTRSPRPEPVEGRISDFVYVSGGRLHRLDASHRLVSEEHASAQPYLWPVAHDVRPAAEALGAGGCTDCHDAAAPIFFGVVSVDSPLASERATTWAMSRFQKGLDPAYVADFARTFLYRPWLKGTVTVASGLLLLFLLAYVMSGLERLSAAAGEGLWKRLVVNVFGFVTCAVSVASGYQALVSGNRLTGYMLVIHVGTAPTFAACAVLVTLFWAASNRFDRADWNRVRRPVGRARDGSSYVVLLRKVFFWIAVVAVIPAIASATLALFPVLASVRQVTLFLIHRYAVVVLSIAAALFAICAFAGWFSSARQKRDAHTVGPGSIGAN